MSKLEKIAKLAKVSKSTVSRVINNHENVSESTKNKVYAVMEKLFLTTDELKRANQRTQTIGCILPIGKKFKNNLFVFEIFTGAEDKAMEKDCMIFLGNSFGYPHKQYDILTKMLNRGVDGIIMLCDNRNFDKNELQIIKNHGVPYVLLDQKIDNFTTNLVKGNNIESSILLMNHLFSQGHYHVALLHDQSTLSTHLDRIRGFQLSMLEKGIPLHEQMTYNMKKDSLEVIFQSIKNLNPRPTALVVIDPFILSQVLQIAENNQIRIPEDISIVSFDVEYAMLPEESSNFITTVSQSAHLIGNLATELLFESIKSPDRTLQEINLTGTLKVNKSVKNLLS